MIRSYERKIGSRAIASFMLLASLAPLSATAHTNALYGSPNDVNPIATDRSSHTGVVERYGSENAATETFTAALSSVQEVPTNSSPGMGTVQATLDGDVLTVTGSFSGLLTDVNTNVRGGAHIHKGLFGQNGGIEVELTPTLNADRRSGTFEAAQNTRTLTAEQKELLRSRGLYVNIHTLGRPGGEIRGQLTPTGSILYRTPLTSAANNAFTTGTGGALLELAGNQGTITGSFEKLGSNFDPTVAGGAHVHKAPFGSNGPIAYNLVSTVNADQRSGTFAAAGNTKTLTAEEITDLQSGNQYVNVHTVNNRGGEIRGTLFPMNVRLLEGRLSADNEVAATSSTGSGVVLASLNEQARTITVSGSFSGLVSDFNPAVRGGAHLHPGAAGTNGAPLFDLKTTLAENKREGAFKAEENTFALTEEQVAAFREGGFYVNVHSTQYPAGELRAQLLPATNLAPAAAAVTAPSGGTVITLEGPASTPLSATWTAAADPNGNPVVYRWQISNDPTFQTVFFSSPLLETPTASITYRDVNTVLQLLNIPMNVPLTVYHRVLSSDGSLQTAGTAAEVRLVRGTLTAVITEDLPLAYRLHGNYPNPFNPSTTIRFDLPEAAAVRVVVFDVLGRKVLTTSAMAFSAGAAREMTLDATSLSSGMYFYQVIATAGNENRTLSGKMLLHK